jgi:hypothetical protein
MGSVLLSMGLIGLGWQIRLGNGEEALRSHSVTPFVNNIPKSWAAFLLLFLLGGQGGIVPLATVAAFWSRRTP